MHRINNITSIVAGSDGSSFIATLNTYNLSSTSITTKFMEITATGIKYSMTLSGIVERLYLAKDAMSNDTLVAVGATAGPSRRNRYAVLYIMALPFDQTIEPLTVNLTGEIISKPMFSNGHVEIATREVCDDYGVKGGAISYLYVISLNGYVISQTSY